MDEFYLNYLNENLNVGCDETEYELI